MKKLPLRTGTEFGVRGPKVPVAPAVGNTLAKQAGIGTLDLNPTKIAPVKKARKVPRETALRFQPSLESKK